MKNQRISRRTFLKIAAAGGVVLLSKTTQVDPRQNEAPSATAMFPSVDNYLPIIVSEGVRHKVDFTSMVFVHRSVGEGMIQGGNMRGLLKAKQYEFWDYFHATSTSQVLRDPNGNNTGISYNLDPDRNTEPDALAAVFSQPYLASPAYPQPPANAFSGLLRQDIIILKSCYTAIEELISDNVLTQTKAHFVTIRERVKKHPDHLFFILTPPPVHPCLSYDGNSARGRALVNWLKSSEYRAGVNNLFVYDLFDRLAIPNDGSPEANTLRPEYREANCNSHPTYGAWEIVVPGVVNFIDQSVQSYT